MVGISSATVGWMLHGAADHRVGSIGVHHVQDRVDDLVAADTGNGDVEDALRFRVHEHLHEALRLALLPPPVHIVPHPSNIGCAPAPRPPRPCRW